MVENRSRFNGCGSQADDVMEACPLPEASRPQRDITELSGEELREIVAAVQMALWLDAETMDWDGERGWDSEDIENVARVLARHGLRPTSVTP